MTKKIYPSVNELIEQYNYCFLATFINNPKSKNMDLQIHQKMN